MLQVGRQLVLWAAVPEDRSLAQLLLFMLLLARAQRCFTLPYRSLPPDTQRKIVTEEVAPAPARIRKQVKTTKCCRLQQLCVDRACPRRTAPMQMSSRACERAKANSVCIRKTRTHGPHGRRALPPPRHGRLSAGAGGPLFTEYETESNAYSRWPTPSTL